jgi:Class II flagellar assembly regulator
MIKINDPQNINNKRIAKKSVASTGDSAHAYFADIMAMVDMATNINQAASSANIVASSPIGSVDNVLAVQEAEQRAENQRQQMKSAHFMLDGLEELRYAILAGEIPHYLLHNIEMRMNNLKQGVIDSDLRDIIEDIELRAAVELAKFIIHR